MAGSYDRRHVRVRWLLVWCLIAPLLDVIASAAASAPAGQATESADVGLQLRVFAGGEDVTNETRLMLYRRGQRTGEIPLTLSPDLAYEASVPPGFYDVQVIRERRGEVVGIRWVEQLLVQRYPDEYGRNLHVLNFDAAYGALQVRPARAETAAAKGWSAAVHPAGEDTREIGKARTTGEDLLVVVPAGRYDIRVTLADRSTSWIRDVDIPVDRTRLKTWSATTPIP